MDFTFVRVDTRSSRASSMGHGSPRDCDRHRICRGQTSIGRVSSGHPRQRSGPRTNIWDSTQPPRTPLTGRKLGSKAMSKGSRAAKHGLARHHASQPTGAGAGRLATSARTATVHRACHPSESPTRANPEPGADRKRRRPVPQPVWMSLDAPLEMSRILRSMRGGG